MVVLKDFLITDVRQKKMVCSLKKGLGNRQVELFTVIDTFLLRSIIYLCYEAPCGQAL